MRGRRITWREGGGASDVAVEAGGGIKRRCGCSDRPAVLLCFFFYFLPVNNFSLSLPMFPFAPSPSSVLSQSVFFFFSFVCFFSSFSLLRSISSSLSPLFFRFFLFPLCPPSFFFLLLCWLLFIEPSEWLSAVEHGEQPAGRPLGATAKARPPLLGFLAGARWVVGGL